MTLLHQELTQRILDIFYEVYAELGHGFLEKVCHAAIVIALREAGLTVTENVAFEVWFRGRLLGTFIADIVVNGIVLLEVKAASSLHPWDEAQVINYLRILTNDRKTPIRSRS